MSTPPVEARGVIGPEGPPSVLEQHPALFDFGALSDTTHDRVIEYVDHLHEHFLNPKKGHAA
ncbi:hypothetical protein ACWEWG_16665 [Streptomyces sp. NPDC003758]|uniref:Uncharacterized protein n=1 Tax=Streptomyces cynarae TaxID=2981134 RepID=A0ABY6EDR2_9ACTN|nr:hypothetical protein [Streptomyces cynarae]UXY24832.1 hypothetical protein N8I84_05715 [Streptomyces cynarae]